MMKTRKTRALAAIAAAPIFLAATLFAQNYPDAGDPPSLVAHIDHPLHHVSFMPAGSDEWTEAVPNYPMTSGDRVYCDEDSRVEIGAGGVVVRVTQFSDVTLTNLTDQYEQIGLASGAIRVRVYSINPGATVEVDTPNGSAVITQPGDYRFDAFPGDGGTDAIARIGALQVIGPGGLNQEVVAGQAVQMTGTDPIYLYPVATPPYDNLDYWSIDRDRHILASASANYVSREMPGFSDLDDAGSWQPSPDYGPVWYPTGVAAGWKPYSAGHWAFVAPWGYTWIDDAPWGYAPFHYGRWANIQGRWGWIPGPRTVAPVYSPALVAFVGGPGISIGVSIGGGGGGGVAAWFPLGVGEPFVPWYHASPAYARQVNVTNVNITNIHNTTIVNNYNTFITNTRTVTNVSQINTANIQYVHRAQVVAVPAAAMSSGRPVAQAAVQITPALQQKFASAPVHAAPSAPAPARPLLTAAVNVKAPATRPTLVTPHGMVIATAAANPAKLAPVNLPKPKPAASMPKPVAGAVGGRPATAQPPAAKAQAQAPQRPASPEGKPAENKPAQAKPEPSSVKEATPAAKPVAQPAKPAGSAEKAPASKPAPPAPPAKSAPKPAEQPRPTTAEAPAKAAPTAKPQDRAKPAGRPATPPAKPANAPAQGSRPTGQVAAKPTEAAKPEDQAKPKEDAKPAASAKPAEHPATSTPAKLAAKPAPKPDAKAKPKEPEKKEEPKQPQ